jgi:hypothetical protein
MTLKRFAMLSLFVSTLALGAPARAEEPHMPQTMEEHLALAKQYTEKATAQRSEGAMHRKMAADYQKTHATPKSAITPGHIKKMVKHCNHIAQAAEQLAGQYERAAEYHKLRAQEAKGK